MQGPWECSELQVPVTASASPARPDKRFHPWGEHSTGTVLTEHTYCWKWTHPGLGSVSNLVLTAGSLVEVTQRVKIEEQYLPSIATCQLGF